MSDVDTVVADGMRKQWKHRILNVLGTCMAPMTAATISQHLNESDGDGKTQVAAALQKMVVAGEVYRKRNENERWVYSLEPLDDARIQETANGATVVTRPATPLPDATQVFPHLAVAAERVVDALRSTAHANAAAPTPAPAPAEPTAGIPHSHAQSPGEESVPNSFQPQRRGPRQPRDRGLPKRALARKSLPVQPAPEMDVDGFACGLFSDGELMIYAERGTLTLTANEALRLRAYLEEVPLTMFRPTGASA